MMSKAEGISEDSAPIDGEERMSLRFFAEVGPAEGGVGGEVIVGQARGEEV